MLGKFLILAAAHGFGSTSEPPVEPEEPTSPPNSGVSTWLLKILNNIAGRIAKDDSAVYFAGNSTVTSSSFSNLMKFSLSSGTLSWQKKFTSASPTTKEIRGSLVSASADGVYVTCAETPIGTVGPADTTYIITKYDANGGKLWSKGIKGKVGGKIIPTPGIVVSELNSEGVIFLIGGVSTLDTGISDGSVDLFIIKFTSNGVFRWQKVYNNTNEMEIVATIATDKLMYVAVYCYGDDITTPYTLIMRIHPDSEMMRAYRIDNLEPTAISVDDVGGVYLAGKDLTKENYDPVFMKLNVSAVPWTIAWQKTCASPIADFNVARTEITTTSKSVVFAGLRDTVSADTGVPIVKFSDTGSLLWSTDIIDTSGFQTVKDVLVNNTDKIYVNFVSQENTPGVGTQNTYIMELPSDGSKKGRYEGEYGVVIIKDETLTLTNTSFTLVSETVQTKDYAVNVITAEVVEDVDNTDPIKATLS